MQLMTLTRENADWVAVHLAAASEFIDTDPERAHQHALSAARKGGRIAVVREALAITAYATGDFALALRELRTFRRISGSNEQIALMVDSERGVGRPDKALELGRSVEKNELSVPVQVSLAIAMSGARLDLGQPELALHELEIPQLDPERAFSWSPELFGAYANVLEDLGREADAAAWRDRAERAERALEIEFGSDDVFEVFDLDEGDDFDEQSDAPGPADSDDADSGIDEGDDVSPEASVDPEVK
ncbi:MAG TPA: hypothetical protein VFU07_04325 [Candidatus Lumbricidophila sp.]|nr:hypothetical protein [Candidatus Lumbricidophila sp.]